MSADPVAGIDDAWPLRAADATNSLLVRFADDAAAADIQASLNALGAYVVQAHEDGPSLIALGQGVDLDGAIATLRLQPHVLYAEADAPLESSAVVTPNDTYYSRLWGLNNSNNVDIDAPEAWGITTGIAATLVAVVDTGIDFASPDLVNKIYVNPGEIAGNGLDDDRNGYVDDVNGWNFDANTANVQDDNGHGSHVAGIVAAAGNNAYGVVGVNWNAKILPLKTLDADGSGTTSAAVAAIRYAVDRGAKVINASWGGGSYSQALADAIRYAGTKGVVFVSAAGNDGVSLDVRNEYPASYRFSNTINVAAVTSSGSLASFSNYGSRTVDVAAPGDSILSTVDGARFATYSGTSMATPYVAGVISLLAGLRPDLSAEQLIATVKSTVKPLASLAGRIITGGIVSAANALAAVVVTTPTSTPPPVASPTTPVASTPATVAGTLSLVANGSTDNEVRAGLLSSEEYYIRQGSTAQGFLEGLYRDLLGRSVDATGQAFWIGRINAGASRLDVIRGIAGSVEAARTKVARWFQADLGRTDSLAALKSDAGIALWAEQLLGGGGDAAVRSAILGSAEFAFVRGNDPDRIVQGLYTALLGRSADAVGLALWAGQIRSGVSLAAVARAIGGSEEGKLTKVAGWFQSDLDRTDSLAVLKADSGVRLWSTLLGDL